MALAIADRVRETTTTSGTGTINLAGAVTKYRTFVAGIGNGNTCHYLLEDGNDWEVGIGTVTDSTPDTLSRDTVIASTNGGSKISLSGGVTIVTNTLPGSKSQARAAFGFTGMIEANISSSNGQIVFPSTQNPSSNANTLDDYREGGWTPIDTSGAGLSFGSVTGELTKNGNMCSFGFQCVYPANADGSNAKIGGLPFPNNGLTIWGAFPVFYQIGGTPPLMAVIFTGTTEISPYNPNTSGPFTNAQLSGATLVMTGLYRTP